MSEQAQRALREALRLAEHGYRLTPVTITRLPSGKKSARFHQGWRHESAWSADPQQIRAWWVDHPDTSFAIGGAANGLEGVDLDVKPAQGVDAVTWWAQQSLPLAPLVQHTPSGGMHLIWRVRTDGQGLPQEAGKTFGRGVDTRNRAGLFFSAGAYVVGEDGHYEIAGPLPRLDELAQTPDEIVALFAEHAGAQPADRPADGRIIYHDESWQAAQCQAALEAVAGHDRDASGYRAKLQHAGLFFGRAVEQGLLSADDAERKILDAHRSVWGPAVWPENVRDVRDALRDGPRLERWRVWPAEPGPAALAPGEIRRATSPAAHAPLEVHAAVAPPTLRAVGDGEGCDAQAAADALDRDEVAAILRRRRWKRMADELERPPVPALDELAVWDDDLEALPAPTMAIGHLVPERAVGWLGGPSGSYKSFVAVSLAAALAYGVPALERAEFAPRTKRRVLYVAGEGASGVALRLRALCARLGTGGNRQLALYPRAVDLTSEAAVERMTAFALAYQIEHVVIDTFRQSTLGVNENDNTEVGLVLGRLLALRDEHGISSTLVDHTNKSAQGLADLGGAGAKRANADYVLMVDLPNGSRAADQQRTLRVAKLKDSPDGATWPIRLESVPGVRDGEGVPSAVVVVGEVQPDGEAWQRAGLGWTDRRWHLPADVEALTGRGAAQARDLARYMRVQACDPNGTGESRAEAIKAVVGAGGQGGVLVYGDDVSSLRRGWARLVELGRLESAAADPIGKSFWMPRDGDPEAPEHGPVDEL